MFSQEKEIKRWLKKFRKHKEFHDGSIKEMEAHLRDYIEDLESTGHNEQEAFDKAVKDFGPLKFTAHEELKSQKIRYKSNTGMFKNYIKIALRNFWKQTSYAILNITGLTIGLSVVFLIGLFVDHELSFDQFHKNKENLYRVVENQYYAGEDVFPVAVTPTALAPSLKSQYPEIIKATRTLFETYTFKVGDQEIVESKGLMVDGDFFEMFSFEILSGSLDAFADKLNAVVLTETIVQKYFPNENPLGKIIELEDTSYEVVAILKNIPDNSHIDFEYITNFESFLAGDSSRANDWGSNWLYTYIEIQPGINSKDLDEKIAEHIKNNFEGSVTDIYLQPLLDVYLGEVDFTAEITKKGEMLYVRVFSIVAVFILLISCINFMNLSTARSSKRSKEVGLRKAIGASRGQLIAQFLSESVVLSLISVVLALGIIALLLPFFNQISNKEFNIVELLQSQSGIRLSIWMVIIALITGLFAGSYPAIFLSGLKPINSLNESASTQRGNLLRKALVVLQFTVSVSLIIGTLVIYRQFKYIQNVDLGYNKDNLLYLYAPSNKSNLLASEIRNIAGVQGVALSNRHPAYVLSSSAGFSWNGKNPDETILFHFMGVDENYVPTMEMEIKQGRNFLSTDSASVIINERALEVMGIEDPIGQTIRGYGEYNIVGVVENFNFKSIHTEIEPLVIINLPEPNRVYIRYDPRMQVEVVANMEIVWKKLFPHKEFNNNFLETDFKEMYGAEEMTGRLSMYFAFLAIIISCLGLFGLVSYATEQKSKEISIRKVLGASTTRLFVLLTVDFTKLVIISLLIAIPISWYMMNQWLESYAYRVGITAWVFIGSSAIAVLIALTTVSYQTIKATISNPVEALRNE